MIGFARVSRRRFLRLGMVTAALVALAAPAAAHAAAPGSYVRGTLFCVWNTNAFYGTMVEQAPWVRAADTTAAVDRQRIWLHIVNYWGGETSITLTPQPGTADLWLYADATDAAYTDDWRLPSGTSDLGTVAGIPNAVVYDYEIFPSGTSYRDELWFPNAAGQYLAPSAVFWPNGSQMTAYDMGVPIC